MHPNPAQNTALTHYLVAANGVLSDDPGGLGHIMTVNSPPAATPYVFPYGNQTWPGTRIGPVGLGDRIAYSIRITALSDIRARAGAGSYNATGAGISGHSIIAPALAADRDHDMNAGETKWISLVVDVTSASCESVLPVIYFYAKGTTSLPPNGSQIRVERVVVQHYGKGSTRTTFPSYFDGNSAGAEWSGTTDASSPLMLISNADQKILSHNNKYDGITVNGKVIRFGTSYLATGDAFCDYDLGEYKLAHVVGVHNYDRNELWVNGEMVASVDITDEQKADLYASPTGEYLYTGTTDSSQHVAINAVAFYPALSGDDIRRNYAAGIDFIGQDRVYPQLGGTPFDLDAATGTIFLEETWIDQSDFETGLKSNVVYAPDQIEPDYSGGLSLAGSWQTSVPLDSLNDTSIYGVMVDWSGLNVTVDVSLDGTTWTAHEAGELVSIISNGYNPTGKDLRIRVNFAGGLADDPAYLESLTVIGFRNNTVNSLANRTVTVTHPAVMRGDYEPNLYRDDNGISLHGGTLTIGADTGSEPEVARTLEMWIKPLSESVTISVGGTKYRNGVADTTLPVGEWSLIHYVAAADIAGSITVTGDAIVGQAVLYPSALTASDVAFLFDSYRGGTALRFTDVTTTSITESATPVDIYAHDWAIDGAG